MPCTPGRALPRCDRRRRRPPQPGSGLRGTPKHAHARPRAGKPALARAALACAAHTHGAGRLPSASSSTALAVSWFAARSAPFASASPKPIALSCCSASLSIACADSNEGGGGGPPAGGVGGIGGIGGAADGAGLGFSPLRCTRIEISPISPRSIVVVCSWPLQPAPLTESRTSPSLMRAWPTPSVETAVTAGASVPCDVSVRPSFVVACGLYSLSSTVWLGPAGMLEAPTTTGAAAGVGASRGVGISGKASCGGVIGLTINLRSSGGNC
mmetsp:Transcript_21416/g.52626  ORF Transcript_21416/g.52626 Transcript_21416/m.52626 type:complete len:270 (-) Transcript_21416:1004-1813(-)